MVAGLDGQSDLPYGSTYRLKATDRNTLRHACFCVPPKVVCVAPEITAFPRKSYAFPGKIVDLGIFPNTLFAAEAVFGDLVQRLVGRDFRRGKIRMAGRIGIMPGLDADGVVVPVDMALLAV